MSIIFRLMQIKETTEINNLKILIIVLYWIFDSYTHHVSQAKENTMIKRGGGCFSHV